jgi:hypothetical protein
VTEVRRQGSSDETTVRVTTHHDTLNSVADTRQSNPELNYVRQANRVNGNEAQNFRI